MSNVSRRLLLMAVVGGAATACSKSNTTAVSPTTGRQQIYALSEEDAVRFAHNAILRSFPGRRLDVIEGPVRGFSTYTRVALDTFTQQVLVQPVTGTTPDGRTVDGYVFDVSGSGTSVISGAMQNQDFFESLRADLDRTGSAVEVVSSRPRRVAQVPARTATGTSDPIEQLRRLRELHQQGGITDAEYEQKRGELLRRI